MAERKQVAAIFYHYLILAAALSNSELLALCYVLKSA
jgi:hypothetical protein